MTARRVGYLLMLMALVSLVFAASALALNKHVYSTSFGSEGSGNGQFILPWGIAVSEVGASSGDVYVGDFGNDRVEVFSASGTYLSQFNGNTTPAGSFSFGEPTAIAVDNSTSPLDPSAGDVYVLDRGHGVIDKFTASGIYEGQITAGANGEPFFRLVGLTVDSYGDVWVSWGNNEIDSFSDGLTNEFRSDRQSPVGLGLGWGLAVGSEGNLYVGGSSSRVSKLDVSGHVLTENVDSEAAYSVAVDSSTNDVYLDNVNTIGVFDAAGAPLERFGAEHLTGGTTAGSVAINATNDLAYVTDPFGDAVRVFTTVLVPDVSTGEATGLQAEGSATLNGTVDPDGQAVTSCEFEYGTSTSYGSVAPCSPTPGAGASPVAVSANLNVTPDAVYHYRLVASNANGENEGEDRTFTAVAHPTVSAESFSDVGTTAATIGVQVNPGGTLTSYTVEYGTSAAYGLVTAEASAGAGLEAVDLQAHLSDLQPGTVYHARVVAKNYLGTVAGSDLTFTTATVVGVSGLNLPDGRVYEMVSPLANADGNVYVPTAGNGAQNIKDTVSASPYRAAADGDAVAYLAEPPATGGNGSVGEGQGNEFLATRNASGWSALDIQPDGDPSALYSGFSPDLAVGVLLPSEPLSEGAPATCSVLYSRTSIDGGFQPSFTASADASRCGAPKYAGISADDSHLIFESEAALVGGAIAGNSSGAEDELTYNLYESVGGRLYLVNVLPDGKADVNATFGRAFGTPGSSEEGPEEAGATPEVTHDFAHVISDDGSRVVWTDLNSGALYIRENADSAHASTVLISAGGNYWGASSDLAKIFFTKAGDLYEYEPETGLATDLTPGGDVLGVSGIGDDGSYVYFVAGSALVSNQNANSEHAVTGAPNLYVRHAGQTTFIATLSPEDDTYYGPSPNSEGSFGSFGDWRASLSRRTAEVTPDGAGIVFRSRRSLTGYDNAGRCLNGAQEPAGCPEVFVYDVNSQHLSCASCDPSGAPPVSEGAYLPSSGFASETEMIRWISESGDQVFFDSSEPLVPQDTNGVLDVYEWEKNGAGSCGREGGCISLISGNISADQAYLVDTSANGDDVFFTSRGQLVPQDGNENVDIYDARVDGGFPNVSLECTGTGCQGVPPAPPIFATPASVTFAGVGNFATTPSKALKSKAKTTKCHKGRVRKRGKCVERRTKVGFRKPGGRAKKGRK